MKPSTVSARAKDRPSKAWGFYLAMVTLFSFLTLFYLWHHIDVLRAGYRIEELKREITKRESEIQQLQARKLELMRLERVDSISRDKLKMVKVDLKTVIREEQLDGR